MSESETAIHIATGNSMWRNGMECCWEYDRREVSTRTRNEETTHSMKGASMATERGGQPPLVLTKRSTMVSSPESAMTRADHLEMPLSAEWEAHGIEANV